MIFPAGLDDRAPEYLERTNADRALFGLPALSDDPSLLQIATSLTVGAATSERQIGFAETCLATK